MKINLNKRLIATLLAGSMVFSLNGCGRKNKDTYEQSTEQIEYEYINDYEDNNEINNYEEAESNENVNLIITNSTGDIRISLNDGTNTPITSFEQLDNDSYIIPGTTFTINIKSNGNYYAYPINTVDHSKVYVSAENTNNNIKVNIEKNEKSNLNELKQRLVNNNINLKKIKNPDDYEESYIKTSNYTYNEYDLVYNREIFYLNNTPVFEYTNENGKNNYYSPLKSGNVENTIRIIDNNNIKISSKDLYKEEEKTTQSTESTESIEEPYDDYQWSDYYPEDSYDVIEYQNEDENNYNDDSYIDYDNQDIYEYEEGYQYTY